MTETGRQARSWLAKAVREPLAQFMIVAALLFGVNFVWTGGAPAPADDVVVISEGRVQQIAESFRLVAQRDPTQAELEGLVEEFVDEEIGYREAVALGLDADDTVVRRRMRQKLDFLVEDNEARESTEAELEAWIAAHPERYRQPEMRAIRHVLASGDRRGEGAGRQAEAWLAELKRGTDPARLGDRSMLPDATPPTTRNGITTLFGRGFSDVVFTQAKTGEWFGPVPSPFGAHLVRIERIDAERLMAVAEVHDRARVDWLDDARGKQKTAAQERLRERYRVEIEWPKGLEPKAGAK